MALRRKASGPFGVLSKVVGSLVGLVIPALKWGMVPMVMLTGVFKSEQTQRPTLRDILHPLS